MMPSVPFILLLYSTLIVLVQPTTNIPFQQSLVQTEKKKVILDEYIARESRIALTKIYCNIGPLGACVAGTSSGLIVAGPDKANPDYKFVKKYDQSIQKHIENYISSQSRLQTVANPSGDLHDGTGLGEPKFLVNGSPFAKPWGRPQRDGPALRAIALITYSKWLIFTGYNSTASDIIWPIIQNDINYVAQYWNQTGFDLWEEINGSSFFTTSTQHRALVEGSELASLLGKSCQICDLQAPMLLYFLQNFRDTSKGFILANINQNSGRSAIDASTILASILQFDLALVCDTLTFQPCSDLALANLKTITDSFRCLYPINAGIPEGKAVSLGRYPEDVYYNGNPWYLTTSAAAEQLYDALLVWKKYKVVNVTNTSLSFFRDFRPQIRIGSYFDTMPEYQEILNSISLYADEFIEIVQTFSQNNGSLSEQFDKTTGKPVSAHDLTWSYAAFLTATDRRSGVIPYSWGKNLYSSVIKVPPISTPKPGKGSYKAAPTPIWPTNQTPPGFSLPTSSSKTSPSCTPVPNVSVAFNEIVTTSYGDEIKISGSVSVLGNWELERAIPLSASDYTPSFPIWRVTVSLDHNSSVNYKYINIKSDGRVEWEAGEDHMITLPGNCETAISVTDSWQFDN